MNTTTDQINNVVFPRFGECTYLDSEVLEFPWGLPGFSHLRRFVVLQVQPSDKFIWLQSLEDLAVALPIGDPWTVFDDYAPDIPAWVLKGLQVKEAGDYAVYCVIVVTKNAEEMTMNLLAPLIINVKSLVGRQITLEGSNYSVRTPIPRLSNRNAADGQVNPREEAV